MDSGNQKIDLAFIGKYLAGEATAEEAMALHDWLKISENKKEFDRLVNLWDAMPAAASPENIEKNKVWMELEPILKKVPAKKVHRLAWYRYAAAACFLGVVIFLAVFFFKRDQKSKRLTKATLTTIKKVNTGLIKTDTLPDGSLITIHKNSTITYTSDFANARQLELAGESYFNVVPDKIKPFIITIGELKIKVVGTSFNVRKMTAQKSIEVQVQSGVVKMYTHENEITISKGQTGIYYKESRNLLVKDILDINSISYATKTFVFTDISLAKACSYLEDAFNVSIKIDTKKLATCRLSAQFDNKPLSYILDVINATLNTTYKKEGNTIYITGEGC